MWNIRILAMLAALMLALPVAAFAQDDDTADDDTADDDTTDDDADDDATDDDATDDDTGGGEFSATVDFTNPLVLTGGQEYDFEFSVTNTTTAGALDHWVNQVDLYMPTADYVINGDNIIAPDALHSGEWAFELLPGDTSDVGIRWLFTSGVSSAEYGDIQEGDSLTFAFRATTDTDATDGFDYKVATESGQFVEGTACVVDGCDDPLDDDTDDDNGDDDDDAADDDDDDDDDDDSGCGC